ncbi:MAG: hypothetical protein AAGJ29_06530 [Pseudomonadota bacterium]
MEALSSYEVLDLVASQRGLIAQAWNMFITVHITVIGGLFFVNRRITGLERSIAYIIYSGFLFMNFRAQVDNYTYLKALIAQAGGPDGEGLAASIYTLPEVTAALPYIYGFGAVCTFITIMAINFISHGSKNLQR